MASGSETRHRAHLVAVRLAQAERDALSAAAERAGLSLGGYVRKVVLGAPILRQSRRPPVERVELARLLGAVGHVGGNVNQLARAANTAGIGAVKGEVLQAAARDIATIRAALMKALGYAAEDLDAP